MRYLTTIGEKTYKIDINRDNEVVLDDVPQGLDLRPIDDAGLYSMLIDNKSYEALVEETDGEYRVLINGVLYHVQVADERAKRLAEAAGAFTSTSGEFQMKSPMPGLIVAVPAAEGDVVKKGQVVLILESMKMENELKASRDGTITSIKVQPRQAVEQGQVLLTIA
ncbi:MAG: biotin/lipoyl-binding protein [Chloroflexi bacterium]|jgi:biotin carboxyl carrier protein|nr:biotin/lipoyl-binding protein [Chloroflexota bacterium]